MDVPKNSVLDAAFCPANADARTCKTVFSVRVTYTRGKVENAAGMARWMSHGMHPKI